MMVLAPSHGKGWQLCQHQRKRTRELGADSYHSLGSFYMNFIIMSSYMGGYWVCAINAGRIGGQRG